MPVRSERQNAARASRVSRERVLMVSANVCTELLCGTYLFCALQPPVAFISAA